MCRRGLLDAIAEFEDGTVMCVRYSENPLHAYGNRVIFLLFYHSSNGIATLIFKYKIKFQNIYIG